MNKVINIYSILAILLFVMQTSLAQDECLGILFIESNPQDYKSSIFCDRSSTAFANKYRHQNFYEPDANTPIKTLKVNFQVIQDDDPNDRKNFENTPSDIQYFYDLIEHVNSMYADVAEPTDPQTQVCNDCYFENSKIQFEIANVYFHVDGNLYNSISPTIYNIYGVNKESEVNIIVIGIENNIVGSYTNTLPSFAMGTNQYVLTTDYYYSYLNDVNFIAATGNNLAHELGHILGLLHTYEPTCCHETCDDGHIDYLEDVFGLNPPSTCWFDRFCDSDDPNVQNCTNNIMGASWPVGYLSPLQQGRINRSLSIMSTKKYVNDIYGGTPLIVDEIEDWDFVMRLYSALNINENGILNLFCSLYMSANSVITINSGGILNLENSGILLNHDGTPFKGSIIIRNGGKLLLNNGSLAFGSNCVISVESGGIIECLGSNTISGSGYIVLNGSINADPGASLTIQGINQTTKLLEVQKSISFDTDFAGVTIRNGKIVMNNSTSELLINQGVDNVIIDNVWVTSSTGTNNGHQGIDIRSDYSVNISNSTFEQGYYGLYASRGASSPNLDVSNCTFNYCSYGLRVYNGGLTADGCTVEYNTVRGIYCSSMDLAGSINNSTVRYQNGTGDYGLYYDGASTATLTMQYNTISNNYNGAMVNGSFNTLFKCNTLNGNTDYGIYSNNSPVYLADATGISAGNNQLYSNNYGIKIYGTTSMFYLNNGYNDLRSDTYCMYGALEGIAGGSIAANNNYWKTGGGAPVSGTNYVLNGALSPITLTDNSPEGAYYLCELPGDLYGASVPATTVATYRTVTTDLGTLPMDETVETTLNTDAETGTVYDEATQFGLMAQVLNNDLAALNPAEEEQATHTYRMFRSSLGKQVAGKGTVDATQMDNMLQVIRKLQDDDKQGYGKKAPKKHTARYFALAADEAQTLWLKQDYAGAISLLQGLTAKATDDQQCEIQKLICQIEIDREFIASNNTLDIEELLAQCSECSGSEKSGSTNSSGNGQNAAETGNLLLAGVSLSVVPHPVTGTSEIQIKGLAQPATLTVYNSLGAVVIQREVIGESTTMKITRNELKPGMYLITLNQNGTTLQTLKMVVQ